MRLHQFWRLSTPHTTFQCNQLKRQLSLLAGTVFEAIKLPLTTWFAAFYVLSQSKNGIAAVELGRRLGINVNTS